MRPYGHGAAEGKVSVSGKTAFFIIGREFNAADNAVVGVVGREDHARPIGLRQAHTA